MLSESLIMYFHNTQAEEIGSPIPRRVIYTRKNKIVTTTMIPPHPRREYGRYVLVIFSSVGGVDREKET